MEQTELLELLRQVRDGARTPEEALADVRLQPDMLVGNYADIDLHRNVRQGMPEVIYGEGKTAEQIAGILAAMCEKGVQNILTTRLSPEKAQRAAELLGLAQPELLRAAAGGEPGIPGGTAGAEAGTPGAIAGRKTGTPGGTVCTFAYDPVSRIAVTNRASLVLKGKVAVVAAGTSDLPVAEEAALTAEYCGSRVERVYDVGVAGLHRLLHRLPALEDANVIVAVAGMEGALVSVIGGLVACPVIGVPTSVGYGANFGGAAALLSMLNSCASGVSVVNIDNGFGAGVLAARINRQSVRTD